MKVLVVFRHNKMFTKHEVRVDVKNIEDAPMVARDKLDVITKTWPVDHSDFRWVSSTEVPE